MSNSALKILAASGAEGDPVYVDDVFSCFVYEGNGSTGQTITNGIDLSGEGGLVWTKSRENSSGGATSHALIDTERGKTKWNSSNGTGAEQTNADLITAFNSNGYTVGSGGPYWTNDNGYEYVSWTFRKQKKFFDVVTWTGNSTSGRTVSHNLGSVPGMIIVKRTDSTGAWQVYHRANTANPETDYLVLNTTAATNDSVSRWNDTAPTSTEFTLGNSATVNYSGGTYVAYLFAHDEQDFGEDSDESIIYCGTYEGDGGTKEITLGWEPQWILSKNIDDGSNNWMLMDIMRGAEVNGNTSILEANTSDAEAVGSNPTKWYPTPTGFVVKQGGNGANDPNENNETYIYVAIRRSNKPASEFAATNLFSVKEDQPASGGVWEHTHLTDMSFYKWQNGAQAWGVQDRLRGAPDLSFNSAAAENGLVGGNAFDVMTGYLNSNPGAGAYTSWAFRRAKGFFDVVAYKGTGSNRTVSHNLGVKPELMFIKNRDYSSGRWTVYSSNLGVSYHMFLNTSAAAVSNGDDLYYFNSTEPTASVFSVGTADYTNKNTDQIIAYLFATVDGISKVGTYTGSGSTQTIDCGFSSGARLVLIKNTSGSANWFLWDSVRGITSGLDNFFKLNQTDAQTTNSPVDVNPASSGFEVFGNDSDSNKSGDVYLFYAIA